MRIGNFCVTVVRQSLTEKNEKMSTSAVLFRVQEKRQKRASDNWLKVRESIAEYFSFKTLQSLEWNMK